MPPDASGALQPEAPLDGDSPGEGTDLVWAWRALRAQLGPLVACWLVGFVIAAGGLVGAQLLVALAASSRVAVVTFFCTTGATLIAVAAVSLGTAVLFRSWAAVVRGARPDVGWVLRVPRFGLWTATFLLAVPLVLLPAGSAFGMQVLHHAAGDGTGPVESLGAMLDRTTRNAATFFRTALVGLLIWLYFGAATVGISALAAVLTGAASLSTFTASGGVNSDTGGLLVLLAAMLVISVAAVVQVSLVEVAGLWTAARTRRLTGRPVGAPAR